MQTTSFYACARRLGISGRWLLIVCAFAGMAAAVHAQTATDEDEDLYWRALADRDASMVRQLLESGANPNTSIATAGGATSLHAAASNKRSTEPLQALIKAGGDCKATDDRGKTPLQVAAEQTPLPATAAVAMQLLVQCQSQAATAAADSTQPTEHVPPPAALSPPIDASTTCTGKPEHADCWKEVANRPGCFIWDDGYHSDQTVSWSGQCSDGVVSGHGTAAWSGSKIGGVDGGEETGSYVNGKPNGRGVWYPANGIPAPVVPVVPVVPTIPTIPTVEAASPAVNTVVEPPLDWVAPASRLIINGLAAFTLLKTLQQQDLSELSPAAETLLTATIARLLKINLSDSDDTTDFSFSQTMAKDLMQLAILLKASKGTSEETQIALHNVLPPSTPPDNTQTAVHIPPPATLSPPINASATCTGKPEHAECWKEVANRPGCFVWDVEYFSDQTVSWSGQCSDGVVSGHGTAAWSASKLNGVDGFERTGSYVDGKAHGHWVEHWASGGVGEGPVVDGKKHGRWVLRWADGDVGEGPYVDGKKHGRWVLRWADGGVGEGPYVDGKRQGRWVERWADGQVNEGPYVDGKQHGHWVERWADGGVGEGPYVDGKRQGRWVLRWASGTVGEGPYVDGKQHGRWVLRRADGGVYEGPYVDGKKHGRWVLRWADGDVGEGPYVDGKKHGRWVLRWADGGVGEGPIVDGKRQGRWVERWADGGVGEGPYVDGKEHGHWVYRLADGDVYEGPYVDGKKHGRWVERFASGGVYEGPYVDGKQHGHWVLRSADGSCSTRQWNYGVKGSSSEC